MAHAQGIHSTAGNGNGSASTSAASLDPRTLEDLAALDVAQLAALYARGRAPQLGVLAGPVRGRLLAIPAIASLPVVGGLLTLAFRQIAGRLGGLWRGKSFSSPDAPHRIHGRNRFLSFEALPFEGHVERGALDHEETLVLRYDQATNPRPVRALVDELREVGRGLYLGPAWFRGPNGPVVVLWWACVKE